MTGPCVTVPRAVKGEAGMLPRELELPGAGAGEGVLVMLRDR